MCVGSYLCGFNHADKLTTQLSPGEGGPIRRLLESHVLAVLSRLTYSMCVRPMSTELQHLTKAAPDPESVFAISRRDTPGPNPLKT